MEKRILLENISSSSVVGEFVTVVRCRVSPYSVFKATQTQSPKWDSTTFTLTDNNAADASKTVWRIHAELGEDGKSLNVGPILVQCLNADGTPAEFRRKWFSFNIQLLSVVGMRLTQPSVVPKVYCFEQEMWHSGILENLCNYETIIARQDYFSFEVDLWMPASAASPVKERHQLTGDFSHLLTGDSFSDVILVSEDGRRFPLHRVLLATRSPVFAAMFAADVVEKNRKEIQIRDVSGNTLSLMVEYIYSGHVTSSLERASSIELEKVLAVADQYSLEVLKSECESRLLRCVEVERVCYLLVLADLHNCIRLRDAAFRFMSSRSGEVFQTEGWTKMIQASTAILSQRQDQTPDHVTGNHDDNEAGDDGEPPDKAMRLDGDFEF